MDAFLIGGGLTALHIGLFFVLQALFARLERMLA